MRRTMIFLVMVNAISCGGSDPAAETSNEKAEGTTESTQSDTGTSTTSGGTESTSNPGVEEREKGTLFATCNTASDCGTYEDQAMACVTDYTGKGEKFCSPSCTLGASPDPCQKYDQEFFLVDLNKIQDGQFTVNGSYPSRWGWNFLARVMMCIDLSNPALQVEGSQSGNHCVPLCGPRAAAVYDSDAGQFISCACLPHHTWENPSDKHTCVWDSNQECSVFTTCSPASGVTDICEEKTCVINEDLEGGCLGVAEIDAGTFEECNYNQYASCDNQACLNNCMSNVAVDYSNYTGGGYTFSDYSSHCTDLCCD